MARNDVRRLNHFIRSFCNDVSMANLISLKDALNKDYIKYRPNRSDIACFKKGILDLLGSIDPNESEENMKVNLNRFLSTIYDSEKYKINTRGNIDLAIHKDKIGSPPSVLFETKRPGSSEMLVTDGKKIVRHNVKALKELILYYFDEKLSSKNLDVRHLIITDGCRWFIFDEIDFKNLYLDNRQYVNWYREFKENSKATNDVFYNQYAERMIQETQDNLNAVFFDLKKFEADAKSSEVEPSDNLLLLYKFLSPVNLLKKPVPQDSNSLNNEFYNELLYILGLEEVKDEKVGRKIQRLSKRNRNDNSMIENVIYNIETTSRITSVDNIDIYGRNEEEQLYSVSLELCITWLNRILFLKLLEAQLISYNENNPDFAFMNSDKIRSYDDLNTLFLKVLAIPRIERKETIQKRFKNVPYLNSSLFELSDLERQLYEISALDNEEIPLFSKSVLNKQKRHTVKGLDSLKYLLDFLDAYDYSGESSKLASPSGEKTLINASVLGLIFEKINGYRDGSFYTPGFITTYVCRQSIRSAVIQRFNEKLPKGAKKNASIEDVYFNISKLWTPCEADDIMNELRVCDPAVGSGHFLVSSLNEIIAIKSELGLIRDLEGRPVKYRAIVENDELKIFDDENNLFVYNPKSHEKQRVQEAFFNEKKTIIEKCIFGVDINSKSVSICRLRLWIELLKNAYYKRGTDELETLPNIDINIKTGNSLVSRYSLDTPYDSIDEKGRDFIKDYKSAVNEYRHVSNKKSKAEQRKQIWQIKYEITGTISNKAKKTLKSKLEKNIARQKAIKTQTHFGSENPVWGKTESSEKKKELKELREKEKNLFEKLKDLESEQSYIDAFEWRYEFPDVLDNAGDYAGFDVIIGNPPYFSLSDITNSKTHEAYENQGYKTFIGKGDIYCLFYERGLQLLRPNGKLAYITSNKWMRADYGKVLRDFFMDYDPELLIDLGPDIFDKVTVDTNILFISNAKNQNRLKVSKYNHGVGDLEDSLSRDVSLETTSNSWLLLTSLEKQIKEKMEAIGTPLQEWDVKIYRGVLTGYNPAFIISGDKKKELILADPKSAEIIRPILRGENIKRYEYAFDNEWVIYIPSGYTNKRRGTMLPEEWFKNEFPAIHVHFIQMDQEYKDSPKKQKKSKGIINRDDQGDYWWESRSCSYSDVFSKQKIIWAELARTGNAFTMSNDEMYVLNTSYVMVACNDDGDYDYGSLLALMNSKLVLFYLDKISTKFDNNGWRWLKQFVEIIPIPRLKKEAQNELSSIVAEIMQKKSMNLGTKELESKIDYCLYSFLRLSSEEIDLIEGTSLNIARSSKK